VSFVSVSTVAGFRGICLIALSMLLFVLTKSLVMSCLDSHIIYKTEEFIETKVTLYNANEVKIGETYTRRARQLVRQQRAMWIDDTQSAIRFAPGMENTDVQGGTEESITPNQLCFAPWSDGYYYPAVISDVKPYMVTVAFLDTDTGTAAHDHIVGLNEAFETMHFECRYGWLGYYKGVLTNREPLVFHYDDGVVEQTALKNLRGIRYYMPQM